MFLFYSTGISSALTKVTAKNKWWELRQHSVPLLILQTVEASLRFPRKVLAYFYQAPWTLSSLWTSTPFGGFREKSRASGTRDGYRSLARSLAACFDNLFKKRAFLGGRIIIRFPFIYRLRQSTMKRNRHEAPRKGEENQLTPVVLC